MGTTTTLLTFEEFERLPDRPGKCELLEGELIELPPGGMEEAAGWKLEGGRGHFQFRFGSAGQ